MPYPDYMDVGIRDLKAHLSEYVQRAHRGEVITVTDRGRPAAVLAPIPGRLRLDDGIREGWVTPPSRDGLGPAVRASAERTIAEVLDEDRST